MPNINGHYDPAIDRYVQAPYPEEEEKRKREEKKIAARNRTEPKKRSEGEDIARSLHAARRDAIDDIIDQADDGYMEHMQEKIEGKLGKLLRPGQSVTVTVDRHEFRAERTAETRMTWYVDGNKTAESRIPEAAKECGADYINAMYRQIEQLEREKEKRRRRRGKQMQRRRDRRREQEEDRERRR